MKAVISLFIVVLGMGTLAGSVRAGAGADMYACVYLFTTPATPLNFQFSVQSIQCMNDSGHNSNLKVTERGVSCVSIGYVEEDNGIFSCEAKDSLWQLSYNVPGTPYSGSVTTQWHSPIGYNWVMLQDANPSGTVINTNASLTSATRQDWHGKGEFYIIFSPHTVHLKEAAKVLKLFTQEADQKDLNRILTSVLGKEYVDKLNAHFKSLGKNGLGSSKK